GKGEASGPLARAVAKETQALVSELGEARRVEKMAEIAAEGSTDAKLALKAVVDDVGDHSRRIERVEGLLKDADNVEDTIKTLSQLRDKLPRERFIQVLALAGSCALGSAAADVSGPTCPRFTGRALSGLGNTIETLIARGVRQEDAVGVAFRML